MDTWTITGTDPDSGERGVIVPRLHAPVGEALARGCEAILDGWAHVRVEGTFTTYPLVDAA